ncbi:MAG: thiamine pyrophosphate-requiring protein [Candidatus Bathyarchaeia archaeon]
MKAVEAIAKVLKLEGVKFVSCFPPNALINASADAGIRTILTRQERVAVNIADGYTRVSFQPGVALVAGGVGIENAFPGLSQAFADLVPMLLFTDQSPRRQIGSRPVQDFDALFTLHKVTKWVERINFADRVPELMRRAYTYLRSGRPSPVVLELPRDVAHQEFDDDLFDYRAVKGWRSAGDPHDIKLAVRALLSAKSPLIYAGEGVFYARAWDELREFAELIQAPVMTTLKAKSVFPEDHPLSVGNGGRTGGKPAAHFLRKADLIFAIGASLTRGLPNIVIGAPIPKGKIIIQSTIDEQDINKDYRVDYAVIGDAKLVLRQMIEEAERQGANPSSRRRKDLLEEIRSVKEEWMEEWMAKLTSDEVPINPYRVVWDLMQTVDRNNTIVTHDSGCPRDHMAAFYESIIPRGYLGWGHHSTLGYSLGGSMGAKLAQPDKTIVNVMGDGAFGMVGMDFETAVREKIPIVTIVLNNCGMGTYFKMTPSASRLSGDYAKIAEALGGYSERVEEPDEIAPAIKRAEKSSRSGRAALLEIITKVELSFQTRYWTDLQAA